MEKNVKIGFVASVVLLLLVFGLASYIRYESTKHIINEKTPNLTAEQTKIYTDRLADAQSRLAQAQNDEEKYNIYIYEGYQYYGLGKYLLAKKSYLKAIEIVPNKYDAYSALFQVQLDMTDFDGARESILKAIQSYPSNADIWNKYILLEQEKFNATADQIKVLYEEALAKTNNNSDVVITYATFLESVGQINQAILQWQKAIEVNPSKTEVYQAEITRLQAKL